MKISKRTTPGKHQKIKNIRKTFCKLLNILFRSICQLYMLQRVTWEEERQIFIRFHFAMLSIFQIFHIPFHHITASSYHNNDYDSTIN